MSLIAAAKKVEMGFMSATVRPACRNCTHGHEEIADRMPPYDTHTWRCTKGRFSTTAQAICNEHHRESAAATAAKQA